MNKLILSVLVLVLLSSAQAQSASNREASLIFGSDYPRQATSCPAKTQYGNYFDGQKCEVCMDNCQCGSYLGCTKCEDGYGRLFNRQSDSSSSKLYSSCFNCNKGQATPTIKDCCFQVSNPIIATTSELATYSVAGKRQISCFASFMTGGVQTVMFNKGIICSYVLYCNSYTDWGKCSKCTAGYYLDPQSQCKVCNGIANCVECSSLETCSKCADTYYQPLFWKQYADTNSGTYTISDLKNQPSQCFPCQNNCLCEANSPFPTSTTGTATALNNKCSSCIDGYYYDSINIKCISCNSNDSQTVATCGPGGKIMTCVSGYIIQTSNQVTTCMKCPANCIPGSCILDATETSVKAVCKPTGCYNGFVYNSITKICDTACTGSNVARCQLAPEPNAVEGKENVTYNIPTQCKQTTPTSGAGVAARLPIVVGDYYLVPHDDGTSTCQSNSVQKCKKFVEGAKATEAPKCASCYTDFGYFLNAVSKCVLCNLTNCNRCGWDDDEKKTKFVCLDCPNNQDMTVYPLKSDPSSGGSDVTPPAGGDDSNTIKVTNTYLSPDGTCTDCKSEGCRKCDSTGVCSKGNCQTGYMSNTDTTCMMCSIYQCSSCDSDVKSCTQCFPGYRLWTPTAAPADPSGNTPTITQAPVCESCEANGCLSCQNDRKKCTACMTGFYLYADVCRPGRANCDESYPDGYCKTCAYGYRNVQGFCYVCEQISTQSGYIDCQIGCTDDYYVRDGDILTEQWYNENVKRRNQYNSGIQLSVSFISVLVIVISALI